MKESDYIKIRNLQRIETSENLISNCLPDEIINNDERSLVIKILRKWKDKIYETKIQLDINK